MDAAQEAVVTVEQDGPVTVVTLNRPKAHNAMDDALLRALTTHLTALNGQPDIRVVVIMGSGRTFSAGARHQADGGNGRGRWPVLGAARSIRHGLGRGP